MIRIVLVLLLTGLAVSGVLWAFQWVRRRRVRVTIHRPPTPREAFVLSALLRALRVFLGLLFRRFL